MVVVLFWGEARPASSVEWERATINLWNTATTRHSHLMGSKYFFKVLSQNQFPHHRRNNDLVRVSCFRILFFFFFFFFYRNSIFIGCINISGLYIHFIHRSGGPKGGTPTTQQLTPFPQGPPTLCKPRPTAPAPSLPGEVTVWGGGQGSRPSETGGLGGGRTHVKC